MYICAASLIISAIVLCKVRCYKPVSVACVYDHQRALYRLPAYFLAALFAVILYKIRRDKAGLYDAKAVFCRNRRKRLV